MTQFHTDEYIDFLGRITPSNMNAYIKEQHKCRYHENHHRPYLIMMILRQCWGRLSRV